MNRHPILSDTQRQAITTAHFDLDEREIERYWTLSEHDLLRINRRRRDTNRFGFAVQLCLLRFPGWPPRPGDKVPLPLLAYVAQQLEIKTDNIEEYFRPATDTQRSFPGDSGPVRVSILPPARRAGTDGLDQSGGSSLEHADWRLHGSARPDASSAHCPASSLPDRAPRLARLSPGGGRSTRGTGRHAIGAAAFRIGGSVAALHRVGRSET